MKKTITIGELGLELFDLEQEKEGVDRIVAKDFGGNIFEDHKTKRIFSERDGRFVNSSLRQFLDFCDVYEKNKAEFQIINDENAKEYFLKIRNELTRIDKAAFESQKNWWSCIYEQHELGLM